VKPTISIREALTDPSLLGNVLTGQSWQPWRVLLVAAMGEPLTDEERATFTALTGRPTEPLQRVEEFCAVVGRRGGKSRAMAILAAYVGGLCEHDLVRGETGIVLLIAPDQRQAKIALDYCAAALEQSPILKQLIANRSSDALELTNGISIEVRSASFRRLRGPTYVAVIADEAAFWYSDEFSANADDEIINAVRPGLATSGGPLIIASSPYAKRGVLFETHRKHFGPEGDPLILVAQGTSRDFNSTLSQSVVDPPSNVIRLQHLPSTWHSSDLTSTPSSIQKSLEPASAATSRWRRWRSTATSPSLTQAAAPAPIRSPWRSPTRKVTRR